MTRWLIMVAVWLAFSLPAADFVRVSRDRKGFVLSDSGARFRPWGFNYDHDRANRLLETYWEKEWQSVVEDFEEMKALGANTIRIHLQVSRFMNSAQEVNERSLARLGELLKLAEKTGLYLDVTGLGCYDKTEVPQWCNDLDEQRRWDVQTRFWQAVAKTCRSSPAVFCYDLMNEPVIGGGGAEKDWTPGAFGDRYFVQRLTLDPKGRPSQQIAAAWVNRMVDAIRKHDRTHLVTVGAIPWALTWPNAKPVFYSKQASQKLDFVSLHFYPKRGEVDRALKALAVYDIGKPMVIEEMFPLSCSVEELDRFIEGSKPWASGWIGFYWGKTVAEYKQSERTIAEEITLAWLEYFAKKAPRMRAP